MDPERYMYRYPVISSARNEGLRCQFGMDRSHEAGSASKINTRRLARTRGGQAVLHRYYKARSPGPRRVHPVEMDVYQYVLCTERPGGRTWLHGWCMSMWWD